MRWVEGKLLIRTAVAVGTDNAMTKYNIPGDHYFQKLQLIHQSEAKERISTEKDKNVSSCYLLLSVMKTSLFDAYKTSCLEVKPRKT